MYEKWVDLSIKILVLQDMNESSPKTKNLLQKLEKEDRRRNNEKFNIYKH